MKLHTLTLNLDMSVITDGQLAVQEAYSAFVRDVAQLASTHFHFFLDVTDDNPPKVVVVVAADNRYCFEFMEMVDRVTATYPSVVYAEVLIGV